MDLRTVKHFIWKQSGDLTLHYRLLNRWLCQRYRTWTYQFYKHYVGRHCTKVVHPFMTSMLRVKGPHLEICKLEKKKIIFFKDTVLSYYFVSIHRTKFCCKCGTSWPNVVVKAMQRDIFAPLVHVTAIIHTPLIMLERYLGMHVHFLIGLSVKVCVL